MKLIDKDAVVAEIKELIRANELYLSEPKTDEIRFQKVGAYSVLNDLLHFLGTLEVKEVDLEKEIDNYLDNNFYISETWGIFSEKTENEINQSDLEDIAKHFYKLGLEAQKGE